MKRYFHLVHAKKTCVTTYLNFQQDVQTESQKYGKLRDFWEKSSYGLHRHRSVRSVLFCEEHRSVFVEYFYEFDEMTRRRSDNPSKQHYNPMIHRRFRESKIQVVMATRQTKRGYFNLLCKKTRENGKLLVENGRRPILSQEQSKDFKEDQFLKTVFIYLFII